MRDSSGGGEGVPADCVQPVPEGDAGKKGAPLAAVARESESALAFWSWPREASVAFMSEEARARSSDGGVASWTAAGEESARTSGGAPPRAVGLAPLGEGRTASKDARFAGQRGDGAGVTAGEERRRP